MGLFSFVKDVGASILGKDDDVDPLATTKPMAAHVREHGLDPSNLDFRFENGVLIVEGHMPNLEQKEKVITIVGNVQGVGDVDDRIIVVPPGMDPPQSTQRTRDLNPTGAVVPGADGTPSDWHSDTYTVKSGDTLSGIAKKLYGDGTKYMRIFEANQPMLKDPDKIYPGQVLRIPPE